MYVTGKVVLITGGTGSFGKTLIPKLLAQDVAAVRILSRDELKQSELQREVDDSRLRLLLGDIRDLDRLRLAFRGVDLVVHAAALKQVPALEYNPLEAVHTNVTGTQNVIMAAIENRVGMVVGLSTDKAVQPTNLYGASKLCGERLLAQAGVYSDDTKFAAVRYGNVVGSRGSVVPIFRQQAHSGTLTITDDRMTRFWITLDQAADFVLSCLPVVEYGGETFVPKIPTARVVDIAKAIAPDAEHIITGVRPGEKLHETLLTEDEARQAFDLDDRFVIQRFGPPLPPPHTGKKGTPNWRMAPRLPDGFRYSSDANNDWLTVEQLSTLLDTPQPVPC